MRIKIQRVKDLDRSKYGGKLDLVDGEDLMIQFYHEGMVVPFFLKKEDWNNVVYLEQLLNESIGAMEDCFISLMETKHREEWQKIHPDITPFEFKEIQKETKKV